MGSAADALRANKTLQDRVVAPKLRELDLSIEVVEGPDKGTVCAVHAPHLAVGSASSNDLQLRDPLVSRHHFQLSAQEDRYLLQDMESTNGTRLMGVDVLRAHLEPGMHIELGATRLLFQSTSREVTVPLCTTGRFGEMLGTSMPMLQLFGLLQRLAPTKLTLLIMGETGTGKELTARALHAASERAAAPFVVFDCAAVHPNLIESELFGHVAGAFTGADRRRQGVFSRANGGTIFLDELGELPLQAQPKLLRVLERREVIPVGGSTPEPEDVRVVAATHRDLHWMVGEGTFREDLLYRLAEANVRLPPLKERAEDVEPIARHLLSEESNGRIKGLSPEAAKRLRDRNWPGNVRELRNLMRRAAVFADSSVLQASELEAADQANAAGAQPHGSRAQPGPTRVDQPLKQARREFDQAYLSRLREEFDQDLEGAAERAGLHPKSLQRLLREYNLKMR